MEIVNTGNLKRIGHENTEDVKVNKLFQGVFGVGRFYVLLLNTPLHPTDVSCCIPPISRMVRAGVKTAYMWYSAGARTLEDVLAGRGGVRLTAQQEIGIRYYDGKSAYFLWANHELSRILFASFTRRFSLADTRLLSPQILTNACQGAKRQPYLNRSSASVGVSSLISISSVGTIVTLVCPSSADMRSRARISFVTVSCCEASLGAVADYHPETSYQD